MPGEGQRGGYGPRQSGRRRSRRRDYDSPPDPVTLALAESEEEDAPHHARGRLSPQPDEGYEGTGRIGPFPEPLDLSSEEEYQAPRSFNVGGIGQPQFGPMEPERRDMDPYGEKEPTFPRGVDEREEQIYPRDRQARSAFGDVWEAAEEFFPEGARQPNVRFPNREQTAFGDESKAWVPWEGKQGDRTIQWPTDLIGETLQTAGPEGMTDEISPDALALMLHEMGHTFQNPGLIDDREALEGGADAFANRIYPEVSNDLGVGGHGGYAYPEEAANVAERGAPWIMHGQFDQFRPGGGQGVASMDADAIRRMLMGRRRF